MSRLRFLCVIICIGALTAQASAVPAEKKPQVQFSDEAVEQAIERGAKFLWSQQLKEGNWPAFGRYPVGPSAIAAYALLESGVSPQEPKMASALEWLKKTETNKTYSLGLRCNVWLIANRTTRGKYAEELRKDSELLAKSTKDGSYGYDSKGDGKSSGDNSNSQYGLLGVWAGAMGDVAVPRDYWVKVLNHWTKSQNPDGGWGYRKGAAGGTRDTMTAAGVASVFVCADTLMQAQFLECGRQQDIPPIKKGLDWFEQHFAGTVKGGLNCYYLYGVERVALASGYKYFGTADWYKMGATKLLNSQAKNGSWSGGHGDPVVGTSFAMLFLIRGRHPVLFNKLEFEADWNNRPRALASLTRWFGKTFEITVNWQIINLKVPVEQWQDAPILYLTGSKEPKFTEAHLDKLRQYVWQGGTILSIAEGGGQGFSSGMRQVYARLFPQYKIQTLPSSHEIYKVYFPLQGRPAFHVVSNGIRPLAFHIDEDLPRWWQLGDTKSGKWAYEAGANVFMYVTDKGALAARGTSAWPKAEEFKPQRVIKLARLKHSGQFDPEPLAYQRLARLMGKETKTQLEVLGPMDISELASSGARVATLTGTGSFRLSGQDHELLKSFLAGGGTLIMDAAGGSDEFDQAVRTLVTVMYGPGALQGVALASPLYTEPVKGLAGMEIQKVRYRRETMRRLGRTGDPNLRAVFVDGRPALIYSREDLTAGLVGYPAYGVDGYHGGDARDSGSAYQIMRNCILYAHGRSVAAGAANTAAAAGK